ncbi:hypothetical protein OHA40_26645 [Nocardia sp. NBC_00508]|uniref:hypothetical protein n=1 Tax=Nocardia sp. NBC_00508 TaxID=2975992 RepID=UPI002E81D749|nr:hypothetical protein [Nocardia sp. NBC_00508]WUD65191.1 hypothetical protein OHA40_26645 [Nocardia sp. NBC_00508]
MRKIAASTLLVTALGMTTGTAHSAPPSESAPVNVTARITENATTISADAGSMTVEDGVFKVKAADGTLLAGAELTFRVDDFVFPITARITDRVATLTPRLDLEHAVYQPVALPYEDQAPWKTPYDREQAAWSRLTSTIAMGASIGTLVGGLGGAAVGCVLGGIAGATVAAASIVGMFGPFIPAAAIGCLGGVIAVGALGTIAGQLLVTAPVAIMAAVQYFTTINAPFAAK